MYTTGIMSRQASSLINELSNLSLLTNLKLVLDPGDLNSYAGSGQSLNDLSGGSPSNFFLGVDGAATATDPTFNGTAGGESGGEFFSFDGGDCLNYKTANDAWMETLHKDNAKYSFFMWMKIDPTDATSSTLWATNDSGATRTGVRIVGNSFGVGLWNFFFQASNSGALPLNKTPFDSTGAAAACTALSGGKWGMIGGTLDEAVGIDGGHGMVNGLVYTNTGSMDFSYVSPASGPATGTLMIGARSDGAGGVNTPVINSFRLGAFAVWSGSILTQAQFTSIFNATRARFGV